MSADSNRREFLGAAATAGLMASGATAALSQPALAQTTTIPSAPPAEPFRHRGYYTIMTRYPTAGLSIWKDIIDRMAEDRCNLIIHWIGGGFRSKKYPETWAHNVDHENIKNDFTREWIDYAHRQGIKVLLGLSPFAYDGVNLHAMKHPELAAKGPDGNPVPEGGIFCMGRHMCPGQPKSQEFMLEYAREMFFEFYPNADGLFIESSDYSSCSCSKCGPRYFDNEFAFVKTISEEVWAEKSDAMIVVYPHYFSGQESDIAGHKVKGSQQELDPRWTLFFTPHSTQWNKELLAKSSDSLWWDPAPIFHGPQEIHNGAWHARANGFTGYVPSLEAYSYIPTRSEYDGAKWLVGRRQVPFGFGWVPVDRSPYHELPLRVNRIAYRENCKNPDMTMEEIKKVIGTELFGLDSTAERIEDLLIVHGALFRERDWFQPSPLAEPLRALEWKQNGKLTSEKIAEYRKVLAAVNGVAQRTRGGPGAVGELGMIATWICDQWTGPNRSILEPAVEN